MVARKKRNRILAILLFFLRLVQKKLVLGTIFGILLAIAFEKAVTYSSADLFCDACHVHPHVTQSWRLSTHYDNESGVIVHCVDCHLPPAGTFGYYEEKAKTGIRDAWGTVFKDVDKINWEEKSKLEYAVGHTFDESCTTCHHNLFPKGLATKGQDAHLYFNENTGQLRCINCHLHVGHYSKDAQKADFGLTEASVKREIYAEPAKVDKFEDFTEYIPGSAAKFDMIAIPAGTFTIGSPEDESYRSADEGPQRQIKLSAFWIGKTEVTWDEYEAFYAQTATEGRSDTKTSDDGVDALTGPTPPYEPPDQGWGKGDRPAITMTYLAATKYCEWLSEVTGKKYRLPTEAEWEYACRGGTTSPYFFEGDPKDFSHDRLWNKIFGADTTGINSHVIYAFNSDGRTASPADVRPNPFGLVNILGNVSEFCLDYYSPTTYSAYPAGQEIADPGGPDSGEEHVVRGGSYKSDAIGVRVAARDHTRHDRWMVTDPQIPKSYWWYSDCKDVGFRVVCEYVF